MQSIYEHPEYSSSYEGPHEDNIFPNTVGFAYNEDESFYDRSQAIPLPKSHIHRTESELDLSENLALAEFRDQCMFNRLVSGIQKQQKMLYKGQRSHERPVVPLDDHWCYESHYERRRLQEQHPNDHDALFTMMSYTTTTSTTDEEEEASSRSSYLPSPLAGIESPSRSHKSATSSAAEECIDENQRSIRNIISTRHAFVSCSLEDSIDSMPSSHVISDDEGSDFGEVFDIDL